MFYTHIWFVWQIASKNCRVISTNKYTHVYAYFIFCKSIPFFSCCQFSTIMIVTTSLNLKHEVFWVCLCRLQISLTGTKNATIFNIILWVSVPTDHRSFRTGPKKILEDRSVQDLKITKRTSKDLFFDPGTIIRFLKWLPWSLMTGLLNPPYPWLS